MKDIDESQWKEEVYLKINYLDLLNIVGNLALSLRHPKNTGPSSIRACEIGAQYANIIYNKFGNKLPLDLILEWEKLGFIIKKMH